MKESERLREEARLLEELANEIEWLEREKTGWEGVGSTETTDQRAAKAREKLKEPNLQALIKKHGVVVFE